MIENMQNPQLAGKEIRGEISATNDTSLESIRAALYRYCLKLTESVWDAEDLVQETCLRALPVIAGKDSHANPVAYTLRIAKNVWVDRKRSDQAAKRAKEKWERAAVDLSAVAYDRLDVEEALLIVMQQLSPLQRTVFLLRDVCRYSSAEVAGWLRTTEGAVKSALRRARVALDKGKERELQSAHMKEESDDSLLYAYLNAIRRADPQAIIYLALVQSNQMDAVQAIGSIAAQQGRTVSRILASPTEAFHDPAKICAA